jgi:hypothetical protein
MEILVNFEVEESDVAGAIETLIWSSIWEILFVREEIAMILLPDQVEEMSREIWKSFLHPELSIRLVVLFSAARILMFQAQKTSYSVALVGTFFFKALTLLLIFSIWQTVTSTD